MSQPAVRARLENGRDFIRRLQAGFPTDTPEQIVNRYIAHIRDVAAFEDYQAELYVLPALEEWVAANIVSPVKPRQQLKAVPAPSTPLRSRKTPEQRAAAEAQRQALVEVIAEKDQQRVAELVKVRLLDYLVLVPGVGSQALGECTGAQCRRAGQRLGPWLLEIAKRLRPSERVKHHLSELELQGIARSHRLLGAGADE